MIFVRFIEGNSKNQFNNKVKVTRSKTKRDIK